MSHPFFDAIAFPWEHPLASRLHSELHQAIASPNDIELRCKKCSNSICLVKSARADEIWKEALEKLTTAKQLRRMCESLLADGGVASIHTTVREVIRAKSNGVGVWKVRGAMPILLLAAWLITALTGTYSFWEELRLRSRVPDLDLETYCYRTVIVSGSLLLLLSLLFKYPKCRTVAWWLVAAAFGALVGSFLWSFRLPHD